MAVSVEERADMDEERCILGPLGSLILPVEAKSAHLAREWLGLDFDAWRLPDTENAQLCVSELVANVHLHAHESASMRLVISRYDRKVRVEVYDSSVEKPEMNRSTEMRETGNGLFFVDALAGDWGCHLMRTAKGKCVWFSFPSPRV